MNKIFCYGDSNTYGWDPSDFWGTPYNNPWPKVLGERLGCQTVNCGEPGRSIPVSCGVDNVLAMIDKDNPDLVIVMLGTNDILNMLGTGISRAVDRMDQLLVMLAKHRTLLLALPLTNTGNGMIDEAVVRMNSEFERIAAERNVEFLDITKADLPLAFDGVHLTEEAHQNLAEYIAAYL